jgi:hypothetical protein
MLRNVFSKGFRWDYRCVDCLTLYIVKYDSMYPFDINYCILCASKNNKPTPKLTQEQINLKKQELKERLQKNVR